MATVTIIHRVDKLNKKGEAPLHFRIIKDRKIIYLSSGISLHPDLWDAKHNRVKARHKNSQRLTSYIANKYTELQDQVFEGETQQKSLTPKQLKEKIYGKKPSDFFEFAEQSCSNYLSNGQISTYDKAKSILKKLRQYEKSAVLCFQDITPEYLIRYENHLRSVHGNGINTVHKDLKFIRKIFNDAYRMNLIEPQNNPFLKFTLKTEKTQRVYLTESELKAMEKCPLDENSKQAVHRDAFIFSAYAGGLRISDVLLLKPEHFDGSHINFTIRKTKSQLSIKLPNTALAIIKKYLERKPGNNAYLFALLPDDLDENDPFAMDRKISSASVTANKSLKAIAKKAGITKHLSFHISRHTWATLALRKGITIDKVSKLLGHSAIKETQIYAKIVSEELDKAMEVFND